MMKTLLKLKNRPDIILTNSDKNLGITALNTIDYFYAALDLLTDLKTYKTLTETDYLLQNQEMINSYNTFITTFKSKLTKQELRFLTQYESAISKFHILPKLHKNPISFRPIVGNRPTNPTSKLSILTAQRLQTLTATYPTILKNSISLIEELSTLPRELTNLDILFTIDFSSLYTNIPLDLLYTAIAATTNDSMLLEATKIICQNNYFTFANTYYHQIDGIAMGTSAAVHFANLFLHFTTDRYITNNNIRVYKRYIDDVFGIFTGTISQFEEFINYFKSLNPTIGITYNHSYDSIDFLDLTIFKQNNTLHWRTHQKILNTYQYLIPSTCHPTHTIKGYIKGECIRYMRTCSQPSDYYNLLTKFRNRLTQRGYKNAFIDRIFCNLEFRIYNKTSNVQPKLFPLILPYAKTHLNQVINSRLKTWNLKYPHFKFLIAFKTPRNIISLVSASALSTNQLQHIETELFENPFIDYD